MVSLAPCRAAPRPLFSTSGGCPSAGKLRFRRRAGARVKGRRNDRSVTAIASFCYEKNLDQLGSWTSLDVRVRWLTTSTTADTERDSEFVGEIGTLSEIVCAAYPTTFGTKYAIGTESKSVDTVDHDLKLTTSEGVLNKTGIGAGYSGEPVVGYLFHIQGATDINDSRTLCYHDLLAAGESFSPDGGAVNTTWDPEGIVKLVAEAT